MFPDEPQTLPRARRRMAQAVALTLLLLFGGLAQIVHDSQVAHIVCPQHGELLHVDHAERAPAADAETALAADPGGDGSRAESAHHPQGHHHCALATLLRPGSSSFIGASLHAVQPALAGVARVVRAEVRAAPIAALVLAPKHSPPARAA